MKLSAIENYTILKTQNYDNNTITFKQLPLPPIVKAPVIKETTPVAKKVLTKLAEVLGLSAIISWTTQFNSTKKTETELKEIHAALDEIEAQSTADAEQYLLDTETIGKYLDVSSQADEIESIIKTKGAKSTGVKLDIIEDTQTDETTKLLIEPSSRNVYIENRTRSAIESLNKQAQTISKVSEEQREKIITTLDRKIEELAKQANELRQNEQTAGVFSKLSNIIKTQAILIEMRRQQEMLLTQKDEISEETPIITDIDPTNEVNKTEVTEEIATVEAVEDVEEELPPENITDNIVEEVTIEPIGGTEVPTVEKLVGPKIVDKIDLSKFEKKTSVAKKQEKAPAYTLKDIKVTQQNRHIVSRLREAFEKDKGTVPPEAYTDMLDFIRDIYNSYKKPNIKRIFLYNLTHEYQLKTLENYQKLIDGKADTAKIGYVNYADLEKIKKIEQGTITQEEFDKLCEYQNTVYKYINGMPKDKRIDVSFKKDKMTHEELLGYIVELHKMIFNIVDSNRIENPNPSGPFDNYEIQNEIIGRICKKPDDYQNICEFLGIDTFEIENELRKKDPDFDEIREIAEDLFNDDKVQAKVTRLAKLLENKSFNDLFVGAHSRMRMLERYVLPDIKGELTDANIHSKINQEVKYLKDEIMSTEVISIYNYVENKGSHKAENICSPKVVLNDTVIALDDNGKIHTIFANEK